MKSNSRLENAADGRLARESALRTWLGPALLFGLLSGIALLLWHALGRQEHQALVDLVAERTARLRNRIETNATGVLRVPERMAKRWDAASGTPRELWEKDAESYVGHVAGLRVLEWIDASHRVRWIRPGSEEARGFALSSDPQQAAALPGAADRELTLTPPIELPQGYKAVVAFAPVHRGGEFDGFIAGVFSSDALITRAIAPDIARDFEVRVTSEGQPLYASSPANQAVAADDAQRIGVDIYGRAWQIEVTPTREFVARNRSFMPVTALSGGLLIALIAALWLRALLLAGSSSLRLDHAHRLGSAMMSSSKDIIVVVDADGTVVAFNRTAERMLGYSAEEVIGKRTLASWLDPEALVQRARELAAEIGLIVSPDFAVLATKPSLDGSERREWTLIRKDGTRFTAELTVTATPDARGNLIGYLAVGEDLTQRLTREQERRRANEVMRLSEQRQRLLLNGVEDYAIFWLDASGYIESWNTGAKSLKQYAEEEVIGRHFSMFFTAEDCALGLPELSLREAAANGRHAAEGWRVRKDGSLFWASVVLEPIRTEDGTLLGFAKVSHDETSRRDAERHLSSTVKELNAVMAALADGLIIFDQDGIVRTFTPSAERIFGYAAQEVLGRDVELLTAGPESGLRNIGASLGALEDCALCVGREVTALRKDGTRFPMEVGLSTYEIEGSKRLVAVIRDISERIAAEAALKTSEATFRGAMESASIGMALITPRGRFMTVNAALCTLLGYSAEELLANDFQSITHPEDLESDLALVQKALAGEISSYQLEKRYYHKDGRTISTLLSVALVRDSRERPNYFVSQIQDISAQKEAQRIKNEFISVVSHELRTPLTSIRGSLGLMSGTFNVQTPAKLKRLVQIAQENSERLELLIDDILDIDKIASGSMRFDLRLRNLVPLLERAVAATEAYASRYAVQIQLQAHDSFLPVRIDEDRFAQVLFNLLSNAAKFSPSGGRVLIGAARAANWVRVSVKDSGPGIPKEFRSRIFQRFSQADSSSARRAGGTGLGLHITRQIVEKMAGRIGFESELGKGTTFWVEFPAAADGLGDDELAAPIEATVDEQ